MKYQNDPQSIYTIYLSLLFPSSFYRLHIPPSAIFTCFIMILLICLSPPLPPPLPPPLSPPLAPPLFHSYVSLSLALRYVLESLKKPPSKKMYLFGLAALDKFKGRLREFPQYCASIASIPHFNHSEFPAVLRQVGINFQLQVVNNAHER